MATTDSGNGSGGLQSVDRALQVLELLASWGEGGVSELAAELGVHKSTAFRLLGALEARELVEQTEDRGKYRLGFGLVRLAGATSGQLDLTKQSVPVTEPLAAELGETVNVAVLREQYAVNVHQALSGSTVAAMNWVGRLTPLHATSSGKVLLAGLDATTREELLAAVGLEAVTPATVTDPDALERELKIVADTGYATAYGELEEGLNAIAVPILGAAGETIAALSASGPAFRFTPERIRDVTPVVVAAGQELSRRVGHLG
ncbi:IclR family transcriptional regulator [Nocardioides sp. KR10-350]|uniref:IclR family transcriptional regulator n=1 Tax=Nocardioides cheoyonin TaxID=3156615 RepID=UPI0032B4737E